MDAEEHSLLLEQQIQSYHELQNQAQRLLRSILAIIGLGIALFSALSFRIPQTKTSAAGGNLTFHNFFQNVAEGHIAIAALLLVIAGSLFLEALIHLSSVLLSQRPTPLLGRKGPNTAEGADEFRIWGVSDSSESTKWISENLEQLATMDLALKKSYWMMSFSIGTAVFAVLFVLIILFRPSIWIYYFDWILLGLFIALSGWSLLAPTFRTWVTIQEKNVNGIRESYAVYRWESRRVPHILTLIVILAIFFTGILPYLSAYIQIISRLPL